MSRNKSKDRIESLIEQQKWSDARCEIMEELKKSPRDHWLLTRLSTTYYEEGDYATALSWVEKARALAPRCPLVLWDYAGTLDMLGREREAIRVYTALVRRGVDAIARDECGEGQAWAQGLLADCIYRAAQCFTDLKRLRRAASLYQRYLTLTDLGVASIYPRDDALAQLRKLAKARQDPIKEALREARKELIET